MRHRLAATLVAGVVCCGSILGGQEWTPAGSKKGVQLHFRDDGALDAREMRATADIAHPASRIVAVVCDFTQTLDPDVREARLLSGDLQGSYEIYLRYAPRFVVVSARDVVINVQRQDNGCSWSERRGLVPERSGTVRMPVLRGSWTVDAAAGTGSRVVYQVTVKPGGRIPGWLVRRGAASALPDVIERVTACLGRTSSVGERC
jgi:hypothetical protein